MFIRLGNVRQVAECTHNLANIYLRAGRHELAAEQYQQAREIFTELRLDEAAASCSRNMGNAFEKLGRFGDAELAYVAARRTYRRLGLHQQVAECDIAAAQVQWNHSKADNGASADVPKVAAQVLRSAIPAVMFLDAQRFQFAKTSARLAWADKIKPQVAGVFWWAAQSGDLSLIAELVESAINAGVHSAGGAAQNAADQESWAGLGTALLDTAASGSSEPWTLGRAEPADASGTSGAGAAVSRLIAAAVLPMAPPPRLLMSAEREALGSFLDLLDTRYSPIARPPGPVRTW
jgi:tetratricopeptide (TPR) repeat protein